MADYRKMYAMLCGAIDDELELLWKIPAAAASAWRLQRALERAEELYIDADDEAIYLLPDK